MTSWRVGIPKKDSRDIVGRIPAPPGTNETLQKLGQTTYQRVQVFFHQQYSP